MNETHLNWYALDLIDPYNGRYLGATTPQGTAILAALAKDGHTWETAQTILDGTPQCAAKVTAEHIQAGFGNRLISESLNVNDSKKPHPNDTPNG